jgi:hypothetical protein
MLILHSIFGIGFVVATLLLAMRLYRTRNINDPDTSSQNLVDGFVLMLCVIGYVNSLLGVVFNYYNL